MLWNRTCDSLHCHLRATEQGEAHGRTQTVNLEEIRPQEERREEVRGSGEICNCSEQEVRAQEVRAEEGCSQEEDGRQEGSAEEDPVPQEESSVENHGGQQDDSQEVCNCSEEVCDQEDSSEEICDQEDSGEEEACDDDRCECRVLNDASSVASVPPDPLPDVQPVFEAPDAIALCEEGGLTVDASPSTGSGGRDWTRLVWSVNATGPPELRAAAKVNGSWANAAVALQSMQHRAATDLSSEFTAETTELQALAIGGFDTLVLSLELENFLGSTKTESVEVALSTKSIPSVLIVGGANRAARVGEALTVEASGLASGCDGRSMAQRTVDYAWYLYRLDGVDDPEEDWTQLAEGDEFVNVAADERYFQLDPFSLDSGTTYVARAWSPSRARAPPA